MRRTGGARAAGALAVAQPRSPGLGAAAAPGGEAPPQLRQLTFGGENAEGYFSPDGSRIIYQHRGEGVPCDQQYVLDLASGESRRVSNGEGKTTCGYFTQGGRGILYASTHLASAACPPPPDYSKGYVWAMYAAFDLFTASADGSRPWLQGPGLV